MSEPRLLVNPAGLHPAPWYSHAVIPLGSRVYVPYYKDVPGATGWFTANDTGGAINGRHVDVYRAPPDAFNDPGRNLVKQRIVTAQDALNKAQNVRELQAILAEDHAAEQHHHAAR